MDANHTRYHLLLGQPDWADCLDDQGLRLAESWPACGASDLASPSVPNTSGLDWSCQRHELLLQARVFHFSTSPDDDRLTFERRRGAGRDRYGNWYWIAETGTELRVQSAGTGRSAHFWSAADEAVCAPTGGFGGFGPLAPQPAPSPLPLSGLAVTDDHYLIVGVLEPAGLLVFDLHAAGEPRRLAWPEGVDFVPFDMAPRPGGGVWVLDRANKCYWGLDRKLNVLRFGDANETLTSAEFEPAAGGAGRALAARPFEGAIPLAASPLDASDPVAIDALPDGTVLILDHWPDEAFSRVLRYRWAQGLGSASLEAVRAVVDEAFQADFRLAGYDLAFVPADPAQGTHLGEVYVAAFNGNQTYAFDLFGDDDSLALQASARYFPMRLFGGKAIVAAGRQVYYDFGESWLPLIEQKRPRYEPTATLYTFWFDSREPDCVWHRLLLDGSLPPDCGVQVWSRTANEYTQLNHAAWWPEPQLYRRGDGSELPFVPPARAADAGTWELLFQRATGRYLQLRLTLWGSGRTTPRLRALRAYYPRFSYLERYLPAVYRDDELSASFLDRFLANLEGQLTALEDKIANVQMLFDVRSAPADVLDWLAGWFEVVLDPVWDERRRRLFIQYAMEFFQYRGTARGVLIALHLALDSCVDEAVFTQPLAFGSTSAASTARTRLSAFRIIERYRLRQATPVMLGDPTEFEGPQQVMAGQRWEPQQRGAALQERWQAAAVGGGSFPIRDPGGSQSTGWRSFVMSALGFVPASDASDDLERWQGFLAQRHGTVKALNAAYGLVGAGRYADFASVPLPVALPTDGTRLLDWYEFESLVLPMHQTAHRFTVLLAAPVTLTPAERQARLDIAERVVNLEKPAHTTFEVKFFWALFRVGAARLGEDTLLDLGSRAPDLMPPFVLGRDHLSEGYLAPRHPQDVHDRLVLDRDRLTNDRSAV